MLDKNIMENPEDAKVKANGTGPYKFVEWVQGSHFQTVKNPNFWISGLPYIDGVRTLILKDQQAAVTQLESGAIDVMQNMNLIDFLRLRKDARFTTVKDDVSTGMFCFGINTTWAPMNNKQVRQAMNWAVNRKRWVDQYYQDTSSPISLEWFRGTPPHEPARENFYTFDLDKARALLQQAGVGNFSMDMVLIPSPESSSLVQIYQADLAQLGITMNIVNMDLAPWLDNVNNRKYNGMYYSPAGISASVGTELTTSKVWQVGNNNSGLRQPGNTRSWQPRRRRNRPGEAQGDLHQGQRLDARRVVRHSADMATTNQRHARGRTRDQSAVRWLVVSRRLDGELSQLRVTVNP